MDDSTFETELVTAAFALGAERGWRHVSAAAAARRAGLDLAEARLRFPGVGAILRAFGRQADAAALSGGALEGSVREKLFDSLMRRFDFLQMHRPGVLALVKFLPACPPAAAALAAANLASMGWLLEAAGVEATGLRGAVRKRGLLLVWAYGLQAWLRDESADLAATMAAVDKALARAEQFAARGMTTPATAAEGAATVGGAVDVPGAEDVPFPDPPPPLE